MSEQENAQQENEVQGNEQLNLPYEQPELQDTIVVNTGDPVMALDSVRYMFDEDKNVTEIYADYSAAVAGQRASATVKVNTDESLMRNRMTIVSPEVVDSIARPKIKEWFSNL